MNLLRQLLLLVVAGALAGVGLDVASPHPVKPTETILAASASSTASCSAREAAGPAKVTRMPLADALQACSACTAAFVDARGAASFEDGHIPGAFHLAAMGEPDADGTIAKLKKFSTVVVYDADAKDECPLASGVAERLVDAGLKDVRVLDGSWTAWEAAQGPAVAGACEACGGGAKTASAESKP